MIVDEGRSDFKEAKQGRTREKSTGNEEKAVTYKRFYANIRVEGVSIIYREKKGR